LALSRNEGEIVTIAQGKDAGKLLGMPIDEYPCWPKVQDMRPIADFSAVTLQAAFHRLADRISTDCNRVNVTNLLMRVSPDGIRLAATDGRRMRLEGIETIAQYQQDALDCLIPAKAVNNLIALLPAKDKAATVEVYADAALIAFVFGEVVYLSKLTDATFPDVQCVIPSAFDSYADVEVKALEKALKKCKTIMTDRYNAVCLTFNGYVQVSAQVPEVGEMRSDVPVLKVGPDIDTCVNPDFLQEILNSAIGERLSIALRLPTKDIQDKDVPQPIIFTDPEKFDAVEVLMPVRK
jgi:DNA polymerase-3 subunit beta